MPRVTCRCGETLSIPADSSDRVVCSKCGAKIRVRRTPKVGDVDGFIRFSCPCGRRLKVRAEGEAEAGKCPDCGRIVPVPSPSESIPPTDVEAETQELSPEDVARLEKWSKERLARATGLAESRSEAQAESRAAAPAPVPSGTKMEAGLRVCPKCGRPVHLSSSVCRQCGAAVPKR